MNLNGCFKEFIKYEKDRVTKHTLENRKSQLNVHFLPVFGEFEPDDVGSMDIDEIYDTIPVVNTAFGFQDAITSFYKFMCLYGMCKYNPVPGARKIKSAKRYYYNKKNTYAYTR